MFNSWRCSENPGIDWLAIGTFIFFCMVNLEICTLHCIFYELKLAIFRFIHGAKCNRVAVLDLLMAYISFIRQVPV